jgi:hypothetical protein
MKRTRGFFRAAGLVAVVATAVGAGLVSASTAVAAPQAPGTVVRDVDLPAPARLAAASGQRQLTYWTEGPTGEPALSTGSVYVPPGQAPAGGWPVVSFAHGTAGVGDDCAPSFVGDTPLTQTFLTTLLNAGYAVVATDYVGLGTDGVHAYLHGRSEGAAVIDMVRAATSVDPDLSRRWMAVGHSQGGHATMFAAHAATRYAPELDFRGASATGTPANLELALLIGGPGFPNVGLNGLTAFAAFIIDGLRIARPDLPIDDYLTPAGAELVRESETTCYLPLVSRASEVGVGVGEMLSRPLAEPRIHDALNDYLAVPTSGYDRPLFLGHGLPDQTVPFPLGATLAADLVANGQDVTARAYPGEHRVSFTQATPDVLGFVRAHL